MLWPTEMNPSHEMHRHQASNTQMTINYSYNKLANRCLTSFSCLLQKFVRQSSHIHWVSTMCKILQYGSAQYHTWSMIRNHCLTILHRPQLNLSVASNVFFYSSFTLFIKCYLLCFHFYESYINMDETS